MVLRYGSPQEVGMSESRLRRAEKLVEKWVETGKTPAAAMLVARRGIIVSHKAFGKSGPEADAEDLKIDALFPISSLTKPITATCIMVLVEEGILDVNHTVSKYIPEFTSEDKLDVRIHNLLTHTTGLRDEDVHDHYEKNKGIIQIPPCEETEHPDIHEYLCLTYDTPLYRKPGTKMEYCNYGYELAGEIVRRVSGKSLQDFAKEKIFDPLGMKDTNYIVPESMFSRVVRRTEDYRGGKWYESRECLEKPGAAGGVYSTVMDMAIFGQTFLNKGIYGNTRILCPITVEIMTRDQIPGTAAVYKDQVFEQASWGYGWNISGKKLDETGTLLSEVAFDHGGYSGIRLFADPAYDILWAFFYVEGNNYEKDYIRDLFNNAVMSSIEEL